MCSSKRENIKLKDSSSQHLTVEFCSYPTSMARYIDYRYCSLEDSNHSAAQASKVPVCETFSVSRATVPCCRSEDKAQGRQTGSSGHLVSCLRNSPCS